MIYFISADEANKVKIGFTNNLKKRLKQLQTSSPFELKVLLILEGDEHKEKELHLKFKKQRVNGEWFEKTEEISKFISENEINNKSYEYNFSNKYSLLFEEDSKSQMKKIRKEKKMTLKEVAELLNIKPPSVKEMESREINKTISLNGLIKFAEVMGYKFEYRFVPIEET